MDRRSFLRLIGAAGAGATLDRKYFFAPAAGWSAQPYARKFSRIEICSIFGVPPHLIGLTEKTATYASVEQLATAFANHLIGPHEAAARRMDLQMARLIRATSG
jgi:hypothetical protein